MWRRVLAYLFAFSLLAVIVTGGVLLQPHVALGLWIAYALAAMAVTAFLVNSVWQWADRNPYR